MADPLWEFLREHRFGEHERAKIERAEDGNLVLYVWGDHAEWEEVVLDPPTVNRLQAALRGWLTENGHTLRVL